MFRSQKREIRKNTDSQSHSEGGLEASAEVDCEESQAYKNDPEYIELLKKRADLDEQRQRYSLQLKSIQRKYHQKRQKPKNGKLVPNQGKIGEVGLLPPTEGIFTASLTDQHSGEKKMRSDRNIFMKPNGLHVGLDHPTRYDLEVRITEISYTVETLTDLSTGESRRASMAEEGPPKSSFTWRSVSNLVKLHVGFAIPTNRIELMLGHSAYTSGKICRVLESAAWQCLPIYLAMPEIMSDMSLLSGDDTPTKVLDLNDPETEKQDNQEPEYKLHQVIDEWLGWQAQKANGTGGKKSLNVSLVSGRIVSDPRSTIHFFRTHLGSFGNLISRILEWRSPKLGKITIQGDLSYTNRPEKGIRGLIDFEMAGCSSHGRRPFWRFREDDVGFCYYMLTGFAMLTGLEKRIDFEGRTTERTLRIRGKYGRMIWEALRNRCHAAMSGIRPTRTTDSKCSIQPWPPDSPLYVAAAYIVNHFEELTLYLTNPNLEASNNGRERALRIEKCMLSSSKFRKTRNGRAVLDILRTINATCTAAELDLAVFLKYIHVHRDEVARNPAPFTPYEVAKKLNGKTKPTTESTQPGAGVN